MIFSRDRGSSGRSRRSADSDRRGGRHVRGGRDLEVTETDDLESDDATDGPTRGPYDISEAPEDGIDRFDLGALHVPQIAGVEIRVQAGAEGDVQQVTLLHGASGLQLGVFAAPRSEGIWDEVRADLRDSLVRDGAKPEELDGEYGLELRARVRSPDGPLNVRFVGVDGPRWFVRAIFQGAAAVDPERDGPLRDALNGLVVDRGSEAMPVREALPLRLPPAAAAQLTEVSEPVATGRASVPRVSPPTATGAAAALPLSAREAVDAVDPLGPGGAGADAPRGGATRGDAGTPPEPGRPRNKGRTPRSGRR